MLESVLLLIFPMAMAFAAANDLFTMRIPNKISLALIAGFARVGALSALAGADCLDLRWHRRAALAVGFVMFSLRLLGGGDAKLMAAGVHSAWVLIT